MRALVWTLVLVVSAVIGGCVSSNGDEGNGEDGMPVARYAFGAPVVATPDGAGSEPSILATRDGSLYIVSVLGSAEERGDGVWKSVDDGATWTYLGKVDYPFGGGDSDLDEDESGTLYVPGQWRGAALPVYVAWWESVATSEDGGATWIVNPVGSALPWVDRQWVATSGADTAYMAFNQMASGLWVTKSADSGLTWAEANPVMDRAGQQVFGATGDLVVDPRDGMLFIPVASGIGATGGRHVVAVSVDGVEFDVRTIVEVPSGLRGSAIFGALDVDAQGRLYYAWSMGDASSGMVTYVVWSMDRGETWSPPLRVSAANTTTVFPWIAVGDPGRVAVAYYAANGTFISDGAPTDAAWYPEVTFVEGFLNGTLSMESHRLQPTPNHRGPLCTGGTGCDPQYRLLGDFFEIDLTPDGRVVAVWVDDTVTPRVNVVGVQTQGALRGASMV